MRPLRKSLTRLARPPVNVRPAVSMIDCWTSGLKARKFDGDSASTHCMMEKRSRLRSGSPTCAASTMRDRARADSKYARSEEHTSELQSLMRISYAVFCLKKKKEKQ